MKYLFVNSVYGVGSTGKIIADKCHELQSQGHECAVAYGRTCLNDDIQLYRIGSKINVLSHVALTRICDAHGFGSKLATQKFLNWVEQYEPDIIWLHNIHGYYINIEMLFRWLKCHQDIKVFWTLHDCWTFTGHCAHFSMRKCYKWKTECDHCPQIKSYPKTYCIDHTKKNYIRKKNAFTNHSNLMLITPSDWLASMVKHSYLKDYEISVVNNVIDTDIFKPRESEFRKKNNLENKKIVLGVSSVWNESKGLNDFYQLAEQLDDEYKIVLVGLTDIQKRELPKNIIGITRTRNQIELAEIYTSADIFVNPTHEDTYPTVNLEARACGTPVITYNVCGSPESAGRKYIVEENDIDTLVREIHLITEMEGKDVRL